MVKRRRFENQFSRGIFPKENRPYSDIAEAKTVSMRAELWIDVPTETAGRNCVAEEDPVPMPGGTQKAFSNGENGANHQECQPSPIPEE